MSFSHSSGGPVGDGTDRLLAASMMGAHDEGDMSSPSGKKRANAFVRKLYEIVTSNTGLCGFGEAEGVFVIYDEARFETEVLPQHFKSANYRSFVRQLNLYDFRKTRDPKLIAYYHQYFVKDRTDLLPLITRKRSCLGDDEGGGDDMDGQGRNKQARYSMMNNSHQQQQQQQQQAGIAGLMADYMSGQNQHFAAQAAAAAAAQLGGAGLGMYAQGLSNPLMNPAASNQSQVMMQQLVQGQALGQFPSGVGAGVGGSGVGNQQQQAAGSFAAILGLTPQQQLQLLSGNPYALPGQAAPYAQGLAGLGGLGQQLQGQVSQLGQLNPAQASPQAFTAALPWQPNDTVEVMGVDGASWEEGVVGGWASDGLTVFMKDKSVRNVPFSDLLQSKVRQANDVEGAAAAAAAAASTAAGTGEDSVAVPPTQDSADSSSSTSQPPAPPQDEGSDPAGAMAAAAAGSSDATGQSADAATLQQQQQQQAGMSELVMQLIMERKTLHDANQHLMQECQELRAQLVAAGQTLAPSSFLPGSAGAELGLLAPVVSSDTAVGAAAEGSDELGSATADLLAAPPAGGEDETAAPGTERAMESL